MKKILATIAVVACFLGISYGNRAVPVRSQKEIVDAFDQVFRTRALQWDQSNYLVNRAGFMANCRAIGNDQNLEPISLPAKNSYDRTQGGLKLQVEIETSAVDAESVHNEIMRETRRWNNFWDWQDARLERILAQARNMRYVGCAIQPYCLKSRENRRWLHFVCLFSEEQVVTLDGRSRKRREIRDGEFREPEPLDDAARAFTDENRKAAQRIFRGLGNRGFIEWDAITENLSGTVFSCNERYRENNKRRFEGRSRATVLYAHVRNDPSNTDRSIEDSLSYIYGEAEKQRLYNTRSFACCMGHCDERLQRRADRDPTEVYVACIFNN